MAKPKKKQKLSNLFVWAILGLLMFALAGFGIGSFGGAVRAVAQVGDQEVLTQDYARALQQEQRRLSQQTGQNLTFQQMQLFGLDRAVLERLIAGAALDHTAEALNLSVGDAKVAAQIRGNPAFMGLDGAFDREAYRLALRNAGLTEAEYEASVRQNAARGLLQSAVLGGVEPNDVFADALIAYQYETRDFRFATLSPSDLDANALAAPTEDDLAQHLTDNAARFTVPEGREITVAWISPDTLVDSIDVPEDQLRALYDERLAEFQQPERVIAERLGFADMAAAEAAHAGIESGTLDFDTLVADRGLSLEDIDQGELAAADLPAPVAEALFSLTAPGIAGPVETSLGPALYRVNALLAATETPFDEVVDELRAEFAADQARRQITDSFGTIDDLLAAGATLEELAAETDLQLDSLTYRRDAPEEGIAAYAEFRAAAQAVSQGDFPEALEMSDGGIFALRLDGIVPAALPALDDIRNAVAADWRRAQNVALLRAEAARIAETLTAPQDFTAAGLVPEVITGLARDGFVEGLPAALQEPLFTAAPGTALSGATEDARAFVIWLDAVHPADRADPEVAAARARLRNAQANTLAQDIFAAYGAAVQAQAGLTLNQGALNAVHASFGPNGGGN